MAARWEETETKMLIARFVDYPVLWKRDHPGYGKRGPRDKAWRQLAALFKGRSVHDISKKMKVLRGMYNRRKRRKYESNYLRNDTEAGDDNDDPDGESTTDKMMWLDELSYLDKYIAERWSSKDLKVSDGSGSEIEDMDDCADDESHLTSLSCASETEVRDNSRNYTNDSAAVPVQVKSQAKSTANAIKRQNDSFIMISEAPGVNCDSAITSNKTRQEYDEYDIFGQYVANELRSMKHDMSTLQAKHDINQALYRARIAEMCNTMSDRSVSSAFPAPLLPSCAPSNGRFHQRVTNSTDDGSHVRLGSTLMEQTRTGGTHSAD